MPTSAPSRASGRWTDLVVALLLVLDEDRQLADVHVALLLVELAGDGPQVDDLQVLGQRQLDLVDVRKLVAVGVDPDAVRVALQRPDRGGDGVTVFQGVTTGRSGFLDQSFLNLK